jgi:hypothetical protein
MGALPPRYAFILNPYADAGFTKCARCDAKTNVRKLPLVIQVEGFGLVLLGKTCRLCLRCDTLVAHKAELDKLVQAVVNAVEPEYIVLGTLDRHVYRRGLSERASINEVKDLSRSRRQSVRVGPRADRRLRPTTGSASGEAPVQLLVLFKNTRGDCAKFGVGSTQQIDHSGARQFLGRQPQALGLVAQLFGLRRRQLEGELHAGTVARATPSNKRLQPAAAVRS